MLNIADWPAIAAARARDAAARLPFFIQDGATACLTGSVARAHLRALARWPLALQLVDGAVTLSLPASERSDFFTLANRRLHQDGLVIGWRDETYPVLAQHDGRLLATLERAASRFWGTTTFGAHCNGYVAGADGRPTHLWVARRAYNKATDPGLLDNLVGGGVPHGQTPAACVLREGWEEAGLSPTQMQGLQPGRRFCVARDIAEGFELEEVSVFDLAMPPGLQPVNQDGEVHSVALLPVADALACAAAGEMTVDAALATLDFALRHRLLPADAHRRLSVRAEALWCGDTAIER